MAKFWKKSSEDDVENNGNDSTPEPQPEKAAPWFKHARTNAGTFNYEYALTCFAKGIAFDPTSMSAHEDMYETAVKFRGNGGKPASSKDVKSIDNGTAAGKFAAAEFEWMRDLTNLKVCSKLFEAAIKAEALEFGNWLADRHFALLRSQKKVSKKDLVEAMDLYRRVEAWEQALSVGHMARERDPSDSDLDRELKDLAAQRAMEQGGYNEAAGREGGFRSMVKDADKQRELTEEETIGGGSADERNLARAKAAYEEAPTDTTAINKYAQLLRKQQTDDGIKAAYALFRKAFKDTNEYRFHMAADDIQIEVQKRKVDILQSRAEASPDDAAAAAKARDAGEKLLEIQAKAYTERVSRYPTDRVRKYELGTVLFELGRYSDAMAQFQNAKDEPKLQVRAGHMLGRCFFREGWYGEAVQEFEEAVKAVDATQRDLELEVKYDHMRALIEQAKEENDADIAKLAKGVCSEIARRNITFRDIRDRRKEVDDVIRSIEGGD